MVACFHAVVRACYISFLVWDICTCCEQMFFGPSVLLFSWGIVIDDVRAAYLVIYLSFLESGLRLTTSFQGL